jgi:hypothetical protein
MSNNYVFSEDLGQGFDLTSGTQIDAAPVSTDADNALKPGTDKQAWLSLWDLGYAGLTEHDNTKPAYNFNAVPEKPYSYSVAVNPNNNPTNGPVAHTASTGYMVRWTPKFGTVDGTEEVLVTANGVSRTFMRNRTSDVWGAWVETSANHVWLNQATSAQATSSTESVIHPGNVAVGKNVAFRTKSLPTSGQLDATDSSNIRLTSTGVIRGLTAVKMVSCWCLPTSARVRLP